MVGAQAVSAAGSGSGFWRSAYQQHGPAILAFLCSRAGSRDDAEELLQETFLRAMRAEGSIRDTGSVRGYLFTTAYHLLRNHQRRSRLSPLVAVDVDLDPAGGESSDALARLRELVDRVRRLLEDMPDAHRRAFELGVIDRMPYQEIARRTGWSLAQVKVNVYRARRRVIEGLADRLETTEEARE